MCLVTFGVVHKSFPIRLMLRSVLFLAVAVSAHLTREVLSEQVGVGVLFCVVHKSCRSRLVLLVSCVLLCTRFVGVSCV